MLPDTQIYSAEIQELDRAIDAQRKLFLTKLENKPDYKGSEEYNSDIEKLITLRNKLSKMGFMTPTMYEEAYYKSKDGRFKGIDEYS